MKQWFLKLLYVCAFVHANLKWLTYCLLNANVSIQFWKTSLNNPKYCCYTNRLQLYLGALKYLYNYCL